MIWENTVTNIGLVAGLIGAVVAMWLNMRHMWKYHDSVNRLIAITAWVGAVAVFLVMALAARLFNVVAGPTIILTMFGAVLWGTGMLVISGVAFVHSKGRDMREEEKALSVAQRNGFKQKAREKTKPEWVNQ